MNIKYLISLLLVIFLQTVEIYCTQNYYDILGVPKTSTIPQIKKAFRNLALKYHPDKNQEKGAEKKFREIVEAYEVLSDVEKRKSYDQFGQTNFNQNQSSGGGGGQEDFNFNEFFKNFDEAFANHRKQHDSAHKRAHEEAMKRHHKIFESSFDFDSLFDDDIFDNMLGGAGMHGHGDSMMDGSFFEEFSENINQNGQNCRTVTKKSGNSIMQHTECH